MIPEAAPCSGLLVRVAAGAVGEQQLQRNSYALGLDHQTETALLAGLRVDRRATSGCADAALPDLVRQRQDPGGGVACKLKHLPPHADRVLALGCGAGDELTALRARYPQAELVATDQRDQLNPQHRQMLGAELLVGDMHLLLGTVLRDFDLIFSHHVLEHSYQPDRTLAALHAALRPGGCCYAVLPLEGDLRNPLWTLQRRLGHGASIHPVDVSVLDPGHPWKPGIADLLGTARQCGFARLELGEIRAPGRFGALRRICGRVLHHLLLRPLRAVLRCWPAARFPHGVRRLLCVLDARLPFGAARLKNFHCPEVVLRAWR